MISGDYYSWGQAPLVGGVTFEKNKKLYYVLGLFVVKVCDVVGSR